jgi:hypothetical protein
VKICTAPIPRPSDVRPGLPEDFNTWFAKTLEREPDRRYASAMDLAQALAAAAGMGGSPSFPGSQPFSSGPTMAQQPQPMSFSPPQPQVGSGGSQPGYASTPQPGALTGAPFTKSQRIPGVPTSRWKPILGVALVMGLLGAGGAAAYVFKFRVPPGTGVVSATTVPPPVVSSTPPPPADTPPETPSQISTLVTTPPSPPLPGSKTAPAVKPGAPVKPPPIKPALAPPPPEKPAVVVAPPPPPEKPPAPAGPPPTKKGPRTSDPGY